MPWAPEGAQGIDPHKVGLRPPTLSLRPRADPSHLLCQQPRHLLCQQPRKLQQLQHQLQHHLQHLTSQSHPPHPGDGAPKALPPQGVVDSIEMSDVAADVAAVAAFFAADTADVLAADTTDVCRPREAEGRA